MQNNQQPTLGHGKICYLEIPSIDAAISAAFYRNVFSWNIRHDDSGHITFDDGVGQVSGMWIDGRNADLNPGIIIHIMVNNAVETLKKIVEHGGKVIQEIGADDPEITARFSDPAGNAMSIFQERKD